MNSRKYVLTACLLAFIVTPAASESGTSNQPSDVPQLASLGKPNERPHKQQVDLGRHLFFDPRLSGDATISCATCHDPEKAWCDGQPLSAGYPGTLYFRNTPSLLNVGQARYVYWDGRLPASDLPTVVRDHISEAHFFQSDGRLLIERLRQVPEYEVWFNEACGGEPTYGRIFKFISGVLVDDTVSRRTFRSLSGRRRDGDLGECSTRDRVVSRQGRLYSMSPRSSVVGWKFPQCWSCRE